MSEKSLTLDASARIAALARTCAVLLERSREVKSALTAELALSSRLSEPMVRWALEHSVGTLTDVSLQVTYEQLSTNAARTGARPALRVAVVLAGNVFTAGLPAMILPLLAGAKVAVKASSRDTAFPAAFARALSDVAPELSARLEVVNFEGNVTLQTAAPQTITPQMQAFLRGAEIVSVYGRDATIEAIRAQLPGDVSLIAHGHGFAATFVTRAACEEHAIAQAAAACALDIAAYDQRGCLSPQFVCVECGDAPKARAFAKELAHALERIEHELPRGALDEDALAQEFLWRRTLQATAPVFASRTAAVVLWERPEKLSVGPGYRNVLVIPVVNFEAALALLAPLAKWLTALGVAAPEQADLGAYQTALRSTRARVAHAGTLQTPALGEAHDGLAAWRHAYVGGNTSQT